LTLPFSLVYVEETVYDTLSNMSHIYLIRALFRVLRNRDNILDLYAYFSTF